MTAFMVAKSDGDNYGQLQVFTMPRSNLPNGPALVQGEIQSDEEVSRQESLLGAGRSRVSYGSLAAIPIDNGLVWVRPFYVTSDPDRSAQPPLRDRELRGHGVHPADAPRGAGRRVRPGPADGRGTAA